jgi:hypothetical protein
VIFARKKKIKVSTRPRTTNYRGEQQKSKVFSYYDAGRTKTGTTAKKSSKTKRERRTYNWHHIPSVLASLAIIISIGYLLTINTNPKIVTIKRTGAPGLLRDQVVYQKAAQHFLSDSIVDHTKITINTAAFNANMKRQFPELGGVSITLPLMGRRPIVEIAAIEPSVILTTDKGGYLLDTNGKIVMPASEAHNLKSFKLPEVKDLNPSETKPGNSVLPGSEIAFIVGVANQLAAKNIGVESMVLPPLVDELHVRVSGQPYFIKFNTATDARIATGTYLAVKAKLEADHTTPTQYVDVRIEEKAYYK